MLQDTLAPLHKKIQQYRHNALQAPLRAKNSVQEHKDILQAIIARDADLAVERMKNHIGNAMHRALNGEEK